MVEIETSYEPDAFPRLTATTGVNVIYGQILPFRGQALYIHDIFVGYSQRRRGIGRALLNAYVVLGQQHGAELLMGTPVTREGAAFFNQTLGLETSHENPQLFCLPIEDALHLLGHSIEITGREI